MPYSMTHSTNWYRTLMFRYHKNRSMCSFRTESAQKDRSRIARCILDIWLNTALCFMRLRDMAELWVEHKKIRKGKYGEMRSNPILWHREDRGNGFKKDRWGPRGPGVKTHPNPSTDICLAPTLECRGLDIYGMAPRGTKHWLLRTLLDVYRVRPTETKLGKNRSKPETWKMKKVCGQTFFVDMRDEKVCGQTFLVEQISTKKWRLESTKKWRLE